MKWRFQWFWLEMDWYQSCIAFLIWIWYSVEIITLSMDGISSRPCTYKYSVYDLHFKSSPTKQRDKDGGQEWRGKEAHLSSRLITLQDELQKPSRRGRFCSRSKARTSILHSAKWGATVLVRPCGHLVLVGRRRIWGCVMALSIISFSPPFVFSLH